MTLETVRRGRIDSMGDLRTMDLVEFNEGKNPFGNKFAEGGFKAGANYYRSLVEEWGFRELGAVADIGSGYGRWSMFLGEVNASVCGYERNSDAVDLSRKLATHFELANVRFEVADVTALPADDCSYDAVWCYNTLQFVDRGKCLSEVHRVLKTGGIIFIGVYNGVGRVLEKFFQGYATGGLTNHTAKFALRSLKQGPLFNEGNGNYATVEHMSEVLQQHGLELCQSPPMEIEMSRKARPTEAFSAELRDLPALADRIATDDKFAASFAEHPDLAYVFPINLHLCAKKL